MARFTVIGSLTFLATIAFAAEPNSFAWSSATSKEKFEFLGRLLEAKPAQVSDEDWRKHLAAAAKDRDPKVREWVANWGIRDNADVSLLIQLTAHDEDMNVRSGAAINLQHWITDNGVNTCQASEEVQSHLGEVLSALKSMATAQAVVETLGGRYSGDKPLACCMTPKNKARVQASLTSLIGEVPAKPPGRSWGDSIPQEALLNIETCDQLPDASSPQPNNSLERKRRR